MEGCIDDGKGAVGIGWTIAWSIWSISGLRVGTLVIGFEHIGTMFDSFAFCGIVNSE